MLEIDSLLKVASLIVINLFIAGFLGLIIGYLIGKSSSKSYARKDIDNNTNPVNSAPKQNINPVFNQNTAVDNKPPVLSLPKSGGKDNLKKIKGIDSKVENDLNNLGIFHFSQIASWSAKNSEWIETFLSNPGCAKNYQWIEQAKILSSGKETIYSQKVQNGEIVVQ